MRCCLFLLLLLAIITGCSKKNNTVERTNFAELTIGGTQKFTFDSLECIIDTSRDQIYGNFYVYDRASHSNMLWEISGTSLIHGTYEYPGEQFPGRSIVYLSLQTYFNGFPGTYSLQNVPFSIIIYEFGNGRIRGRFSGKLFCYNCNPYGTEVDLTDGEFEMPYSYR